MLRRLFSFFLSHLISKILFYQDVLQIFVITFLWYAINLAIWSLNACQIRDILFFLSLEIIWDNKLYICFLKKAITILFLIIYMFSGIDANQLQKIHVVFDHYKEHQQEDKNISMLRFLAIHYLHGSPKDKDYDRDMQLPFKTTDDCISSITTAFVPLMAQYFIVKPIEIKEKKRFFSHDQFVSSSYLSNIWQPPKSC